VIASASASAFVSAPISTFASFSALLGTFAPTSAMAATVLLSVYTSRTASRMISSSSW